jgi:RNA polymerase sigma-70 factor (ECF subfamily)
MSAESILGPLTAERERELVGRMRAGEEGAFEMFSERYIPALHRFALRRLDGDRELALEIVQATLCRVIEKLDTYRGDAPLFTWLCACCRNEIAGHFRRLGRRPREVELDESEHGRRAGAAGARSDGPEERMMRLETAELVHAALDLMPPSYSRAIAWRYMEGIAVGDIALRLDAGYKATESLLSRAREAFRVNFDRLARAQGDTELPGAFRAEGAGP